MSNFPIIPTTPPPLDANESDEEEEPDFRSFNNVLSPEEEKDIDFVIPDFSNDNELEVLTEELTERQTSPHFNDKITSEDKDNSEDIDNKSIDEKDINFCDNNSFETKISENETQIVETNEELNEFSVDSNENHLKSNQNHLNDDNIKENIPKLEVKYVEEEDEFCDFNGVDTDDNDFEFADFTSYQSTECKEDIKEDLKQCEESFDENQSFSFYKSEISFGDFKDSLQTESDAINVSQNIENNLNDSESDDDFADFASAQPVLNTDFQSVSSFKPNIRDQIETDDKDDGFADFASFQDSVDNCFVDNSAIHSNSTEESDKLKELLAQVFPNEEPIDSVDNSPNISRDLFNSADQNSKSLWKELQDLESAPSLKLKWSTSHSFQLLLTALNIDPRNILRNPSVPMFASGLGCVLEPTKPRLNGDLSDEIESEKANELTTSSIPPVHFDWGSSGLTNPLDVNQKSVVAFDLDFFVTNDDVKNTSKQTGISNLEEELLNDIFDSESNSQNLDKNKNNLMQQILSSVGNTSTISMPQSNGNQVLSAEALQVLDELPNLSFLRSKVLMFPINIRPNP